MSSPPRFRTALIAAVVALFPLLVAVAYLGSRSSLPELANLKVSLPPSNGSINTMNSINFTSLEQGRAELFSSLNLPSLPSLPEVNLVEVLLAATAVVVVIVLIRGFRTRRARTSPFDYDELIDEKRRKLAAAVDIAVARLKSGSPFRETVIQCYKMISQVLEERTDVEGKVLTPKEFERRVSEKLGVDTPYLSQVTELFEVARYSEHEITGEQADEAVVCLSKFSAPLKQSLSSAGDIR